MGALDQGLLDINNRWRALVRVMCLIRHNNDYLMLQRSSKSSVFPDRFCGVGGHIESTEDILTGLEREVLEETKLELLKIRLKCIYTIDGRAPQGLVLFLFTAESRERRFRSNKTTGELLWVPKEKILSLNLTDDLPFVLPEIISSPENESLLFYHLSYEKNDNVLVTKRILVR